MSLVEDAARLRKAREQTYRESFGAWVESDRDGAFPSLGDEGYALIHYTAEGRFFNRDAIKAGIPESLRSHFDQAQRLMVGGELFFSRFAAYTQMPHEGILLGFGADDIHYVLATWDNQGADTWMPTMNAFGRMAA